MGKPPVNGGFPHEGSIMQNFEVLCCLDRTTYQGVTSGSPSSQKSTKPSIFLLTHTHEQIFVAIAYKEYVDELMQDCSYSIVNALELLQSYTKASVFLPTHTHEQMFAAIVHRLPYSFPVRSHTGS